MNNSDIEWTDITWNPVTGCSKVSQGCKNCYAERVFPRVYSRDWIKGDDTIGRPREFTDVRTHPDRLDAPMKMRKPKRIFVNSMSDLFHEDLPDQFIDDVFVVMALAQQHQFQILTKRPERMRRFMSEDFAKRYARIADAYPHDHEVENRLDIIRDLDGPLPNVWLGVSVEDQATADERIPLLLQTPAAVRFISAEPLLGPVDLRNLGVPQRNGNGIFLLDALTGNCKDIDQELLRMKMRAGNSGGFRIDLVIAGGESGPRARPSHPNWFRMLRDQCAAAGVPFFFKQWGEFIGGTFADKFLPFDREPDHCWGDDGDYASFRVGKKAAGRILDGREHSELPT